MSRIAERKPAAPPPDPDPIFEDNSVLELCAEWRIARATMQIIWAKDEVCPPTIGIPGGRDFEPLNRMHEIEHHLSRSEPHTLLCARELLGVAVTMLTHSDRESTLAQGPVLEIVRNVRNALGNLKGTLGHSPAGIRPSISRAAR